MRLMVWFCVDATLCQQYSMVVSSKVQAGARVGSDPVADNAVASKDLSLAVQGAISSLLVAISALDHVSDDGALVHCEALLSSIEAAREVRSIASAVDASNLVRVNRS